MEKSFCSTSVRSDISGPITDLKFLIIYNNTVVTISNVPRFIIKFDVLIIKI